MLDRGGGGADLLGEFAHGAGGWLLAPLVERPGRDLEHYATHRRTELSDQDGVVTVDGHDRDGSRVTQERPLERLATGRLEPALDEAVDVPGVDVAFAEAAELGAHEGRFGLTRAVRGTPGLLPGHQ
ncbi:MAG: hypothetical protein NVSMB16_12800 [Acidimicrobiales bacterium]